MSMIRFNNRNPADLLNIKLSQLFRGNSKFDVDLVSSDGKTVPAHRLILSMYSKYLRQFFSNTSCETKVVVPLNDFSWPVLQKVVELFYCGDIRVVTALKGKVYKALQFLNVEDIDYPTPPAPRNKKDKDDPPMDVSDMVLPTQQAGNLQGSQPQPLQQTPQQRQKQQQPAKQASHSASTGETNKKDDHSLTGDNAHMKSVRTTDGAAELQNKTSTATISNNANIAPTNNETNDGGIQLSSLYDEHIAADTDTLEKTVKDLDIDFGTTELNSIQNAGDSTAGQTQ